MVVLGGLEAAPSLSQGRVRGCGRKDCVGSGDGLTPHPGLLPRETLAKLPEGAPSPLAGEGGGEGAPRGGAASEGRRCSANTVAGVAWLQGPEILERRCAAASDPRARGDRSGTPRVTSGSPLTLTLSRQGRGDRTALRRQESPSPPPFSLSQSSGRGDAIGLSSPHSPRDGAPAIDPDTGGVALRVTVGRRYRPPKPPPGMWDDMSLCASTGSSVPRSRTPRGRCNLRMERLPARRRIPWEPSSLRCSPLCRSEAPWRAPGGSSLSQGWGPGLRIEGSPATSSALVVSFRAFRRPLAGSSPEPGYPDAAPEGRSGCARMLSRPPVAGRRR